MRPDLVIIEGGKITDIFEIKFVPQGYPVWEQDIGRLRGSINPEARYHVRLNPQAGQWDLYLRVQEGGCLLLLRLRGMMLKPYPLLMVKVRESITGMGRAAMLGEWDIR